MSGDDLRTILRCFRAPWHDLIQADISRPDAGGQVRYAIGTSDNTPDSVWLKPTQAVRR